MMMRPRAVSMFLPQVNEIVDDFVDRLQRIRVKDSGLVPSFKNELLKWNLECRHSVAYHDILDIILSLTVY